MIQDFKIPKKPEKQKFKAAIWKTEKIHQKVNSDTWQASSTKNDKFPLKIQWNAQTFFNKKSIKKI